MNRFKTASLALLVLAWSLPCLTQIGPAGVFDQVALFSTGAIRQAEQTLQGLRDQTGWQVAIQTIDALNGQDIQERAPAGANKARVHGLYVLISKTDRKLRIVPGPGTGVVFPEPKVRAVTDAFTARFKQNAFDQGLLDAVDQIKLDAVAAPNPRPRGPTPSSCATTPICSRPARSSRPSKSCATSTSTAAGR